MMDTLKGHLLKKATKKAEHRPIFFNLRNARDRNSLNKLFQSNNIKTVRDEYLLEEEEYYAVTHPFLVYLRDFKKNFLTHIATLEKKAPLWQHGRWVYFPWNFTLIHILEEEAFYQVRTARNRDLITDKEQYAFYHSCVGIIGLSIGHSVALALALQGGARHMKLIDFDTLVLSNLNRIPTGVHNLGLKKTLVVSREIYAINPYMHIEIFSSGLKRNNFLSFFKNLDIVVDEMDDFPMKVLVRDQARKQKIPVLMAIDNADSGIIDIERYDKSPQPPLFHGRIGDIITLKGMQNLTKLDIGRLITKHVGVQNVTERMQNSLLGIGKTIVSWPQLGGTALINGVAIAYCVRRILNRQPLENNRAIISLEKNLLPRSREPKQNKKKNMQRFKKDFGL